VVNTLDLLWVINHWGEAIATGDGVDPVNVADLLLVINKWGCQGQ
jgi:hypothetical protein